MDSINKYEVLKLLGSVLENNNIKNSQIKKICLEFDKALEYGEADKHKSKMSKFFMVMLFDWNGCYCRNSL
jgi:hypothetical protein